MTVSAGTTNFANFVVAMPSPVPNLATLVTFAQLDILIIAVVPTELTLAVPNTVLTFAKTVLFGSIN